MKIYLISLLILITTISNSLSFDFNFIINNPFNSSSYRFINDFYIFLEFSLKNSNLLILSLIIFFILIISLLTIFIFHVFFQERLIKTTAVEREFSFIDKFSWIFLISKLKFLRTQMRISNLSIKEVIYNEDEDLKQNEYRKYQENLFYGAEWKMNNDFVIYETNQKILISAYFAKLREVFKINEENLSVLSEDLYYNFSEDKKKERKIDEVNKESKENQNLSNKVYLLNNLKMTNNEEVLLSEDIISKNEISNKIKEKDILKVKYSSSIKTRKTDFSALSSDTYNTHISDENENIVIMPITFSLFKEMFSIVSKNSICLISCLYKNNLLMNFTDLILIFSFKIYFYISISSLISPNNIPENEYFFSFSNIISSVICFLVYIPFGFLIEKLLKKQKIGNLSEETVTLKIKRYNLFHILGYLLLIVLSFLMITNSIWVCLYMIKTISEYNVLLDISFLLIFDFIFLSLLSISFKSIVYLMIFKSSNVDCFKKFLIFLTFFFY